LKSLRGGLGLIDNEKRRWDVSEYHPKPLIDAVTSRLNAEEKYADYAAVSVSEVSGADGLAPGKTAQEVCRPLCHHLEQSCVVFTISGHLIDRDDTSNRYALAHVFHVASLVIIILHNLKRTRNFRLLQRRNFARLDCFHSGAGGVPEGFAGIVYYLTGCFAYCVFRLLRSTLDGIGHAFGGVARALPPSPEVVSVPG
jgi:hypothetical protein